MAKKKGFFEKASEQEQEPVLEHLESEEKAAVEQALQPEENHNLKQASEMQSHPKFAKFKKQGEI